MQVKIIIRFCSPTRAIRKIGLLCLVATASLTPAFAQETGGPIRPLANDYVVLGESPDPKTIPLYTPSILTLPSGRLVASYERGGKRNPDEPFAFILTSDDGGKTWAERAKRSITHGRLFIAGKSIYFLGHEGDLKIARSDDNGETWSETQALTNGERWHQTAANVWHTRGNVYLVMEKHVEDMIRDTWSVGQLAPILMRADENADLTKRESWTFASELNFSDIIPGYRENEPEINFFGVPFFRQNYPHRAPVHTRSRYMAPMGWLEANVVQINDPDNYWYDPSGKTFHLFLRANTGGVGYAALAQVVENDDGTMTTELVHAPSGKTMLFMPFPGGQMRFHVIYDEKTKLYWMLGTQTVDSMTRTDHLGPDRFDLPYNERQRMVLHFSKNMVDWCFAGLVAVGNTPKEARHYASMDIDGDDLIILSRSGNEHAKSSHDGNIITFHRVKNFRDLVY